MISLRPMTKNDLPMFKSWLYMPHVAKWYLHPLNWIAEAEQEDSFAWIHHYIAEKNGTPFGFCQYYACADSDELWDGYTALGGSYSIDYLIGETDCLRRGFGREIIHALTQKIRCHSDAKRIVVQPDKENLASRRALMSCGFDYDSGKDIFVLVL